jgi:hypothetical protein
MEEIDHGICVGKSRNEDYIVTSLALFEKPPVYF